MRTTIQAVALSVIAMTAGDALATHRQTPFLLEIPFGANSEDPSFPPQAQGIQAFRPFSQGESARWISYDSTSDLLGNGSSGSEIFIFDNQPPRSNGQVTNCALGESTNPANTSNGKTIVFESTSNIASPPSTRCTQLLPARRIFRAQLDKGRWSYDELTGGLGPADCSEPVITPEGFRVTFQCAGDLRRNGSPGQNIYLWRNDQVCQFDGSVPPCSKVQQITPTGDWVSGNPEFNLLSTSIVFNSNAPIGGPSNGSQQIYLYNIVTNAPFPAPIRLTNGVGDSTNPSMNQDGRLVVFQSTADLLATGSTGSELFLLDRQTGVLRQLTDGDGDSTLPSMGGGGRYIIFLSTGAVAGGGIGTAQVYLYDLIDEALYQVTNAGSGGNPIATSDTIFFFDSDGDPLGIGLTGRHVYALNVFQQLPPRALGPAKFRLLPGEEIAPGSGRMSGSSVRLINASTFGQDPAFTHTEFPIGNQSLGAGELSLAMLGRNIDKEGKVAVPSMIIPPIPVPSFGAICLQQTGRGEGEIDCDGDALDTEPFLEAQGDALDYRTLQDHVTNLSSPTGAPPEDPFCQFGCKEGSECPGPLQAPPGVECYRCKSEPGVCAEGPRVGQACEFDTQCPGKPPVFDFLTGALLVPGACDLTRPQTDPFGIAHIGTCFSGVRDNLWCDTDGECPADCLAQQTCDGGPNDGQTCDSDRDCDTLEQCEDGTIDICQGPPVLTRSGTFEAGDMELKIPTLARFATNPGFDGLYCTGDDTYALAGAGLESVLRLTTGAAKATITDTDYQPGLTIGASEEGAPFSCERWQDTRGRDLSGARLVGALTFLNVPNIPFQHDTIVTFRFVADPGPECIGDACADPCTDDNGCRDDNPCDGEEFCHLGSCHPGVPVSCDDGNECNGTEACTAQDQGGFRRAMCVPGPDVNCNDGNICNFDQCRADFLCVHPPNPQMNDQPCDDGNLCTSQDLDPATVGPCAVGELCDRCNAGACVGANGQINPALNDVAALLPCNSDNNRCDGIEVCDRTTGNSCTLDPLLGATPPLVCLPDTNPCTLDGCDPTYLCNPPAELVTGTAVACDDANLCTDPDQCQNRRCIGDLSTAAATCNLGDGDICNGVESCNPLSGACESTAVNCDDANLCTDDTCDPLAETVVAACIHTNNTLACDDTNACTDASACVGGRCVGTLSAVAVACNVGDANLCTGVEQCNTTTGACDATPLACDDANPCTSEVCDPIGGCQYTLLTGACDDGNACTGPGECVNGACLAAPTAEALGCSDGDACNGFEACDPASGTCLVSTPLFCEDGDGCTIDTCDPLTGCSNTGIGGLEGALCEIDAILDQLAGPPPGSFKGTNLRRRLTKLALRARVKVEFATRAGNVKAIALLKGADKKLQVFIRKSENGAGLDRMSDDLMHALNDRARKARGIIQGVRANLR